MPATGSESATRSGVATSRLGEGVKSIRPGAYPELAWRDAPRHATHGGRPSGRAGAGTSTPARHPRCTRREGVVKVMGTTVEPPSSEEADMADTDRPGTDNNPESQRTQQQGESRQGESRQVSGVDLQARREQRRETRRNQT